MNRSGLFLSLFLATVVLLSLLWRGSPAFPAPLDRESPVPPPLAAEGEGSGYHLDEGANLRFHPFEKGWSPSLPTTARSHLHLAEAQGLYEAGEIREAVELWRAVALMGEQEEGGGEREERLRLHARRARSLLNQLRSRESARPYLMWVDPVAYLDAKGDRTVVVSEGHGWSAELPGAWRFLRERPGSLREARKEGTKSDLRIVRLARGARLVSLVSEIRPSLTRSTSLPGERELADYILLWDRRRGLTPRQKQMRGVRRELHPLHERFCGAIRIREKNSFFRPGAGEPAYRCGVYRFSDARGQRLLEYYALTHQRGFYLVLHEARSSSASPSEGEGTPSADSLDSLFERLLSHLRLATWE